VGGMTRQRLYLVLAAAAGVALLAWTIHSVGPSVLVRQLRALAPVLPLLLGLAALRFLLQAAGWRLALDPANRPPWGEIFNAVLAGEAAGYFAWGPVSREPMKAFLIGDRVPRREGLAAAIVERSLYTIVAAGLILAAIGIVAVRYGRLWWFLVAGAAVAAMAMSAKRYWQPLGRIVQQRDTAGAILACAAAQELSNVVEAYVVLAWLGAAPTITSVLVFEGISRLMNGAGQFIPGKLGISEAASAALSEGLRLGAAHGLSLALARRVRSLAWGTVGIAVVAMRAARTRQAEPARYLITA
jgi:Lysylphosphatidylglycerol synthase TM region